MEKRNESMRKLKNQSLRTGALISVTKLLKDRKLRNKYYSKTELFEMLERAHQVPTTIYEKATHMTPQNLGDKEKN